jgi:hypothetical protein
LGTRSCYANSVGELVKRRELSRRLLAMARGPGTAPSAPRR